MNPALATVLRSFGFAVGFCMLLAGGAGAAVMVFDLAHADLPALGEVVWTASYLGLPLLAFRAYDRTKRATT